MSIRSEIEKENKALKAQMSMLDDQPTVAALVAIYERLGDIETLIAERDDV